MLYLPPHFITDLPDLSLDILKYYPIFAVCQIRDLLLSSQFLFRAQNLWMFCLLTPPSNLQFPHIAVWGSSLYIVTHRTLPVFHIPPRHPQTSRRPFSIICMSSSPLSTCLYVYFLFPNYSAIHYKIPVTCSLSY